MNRADAADRGRHAKRPGQIPPRGWWDVTLRLKEDLSRHNVSLLAAGLAMYALLAVFPGLTATAFVYGLFGSPRELIAQLQSFSAVLPPGVWDLLRSQLQALAGHPHETLTAAAAASVLVALWSARSGMASLITAANIAYGERERRGLLVQILLSLAFTLGALLSFVLLLMLALAVPAALRVFGFGGWIRTAAAVVRWLLLWCFAIFALALVYRFAPSRERPRWRWLTAGSVGGATLWLVGSVLFGIYVGTFGSYQKNYGALGGVVVLLMWFYLSSFAVLLGAEINAEAERQTLSDTTTGRPEALGARGAYAADTVGPAAGHPEPHRRRGGSR